MKEKSLVLNLFLLGIFISSFIYSPFILDYTLSPRLISLSLVVLICLFLLYRRKEIIQLKLDRILLFYFAFVAFNILSFFWANTKSEAIFESSKVILSLGTFLLSFYFLKKNKGLVLNALCKISILLFVLEFALSIFQASQIKVFNFNKEVLYGIYGFNSHKNLLSSYLFLNLFFLILGIKRLEKTWRLLAITCLVLNLTIIALIQTKAVWVGILVSAILFLLLQVIKLSKLKFNFKITLALCVLAANLFFIFALPRIIEKGLEFNAVQNKTELDNERLLLWKKSYYIIREHPLTGVGAGNWQINFPNATLKGLWRAEDLNYTFQRPHNDFLWVISEVGFIGFNLFLIFVSSILLLLIKSLKEKKHPPFELFICICFLIGYFTISFFDFPKERIEHLIWLNIILAFAFLLVKELYALKTILQINLKAGNLTSAFVCVFLISTIVGIYRYKGEYYTREMYNQKTSQNTTRVIKEGQKAISFAYTIDPMSIPIKWYIGNAEATLGNFAKAKNDFLVALDQNPFNRNVLNDLASSYVENSQPDLAFGYYLEACRISPRFDDPKLNLAVLFFNQGQFIKADSCLQTLFHDSEKRTKYQKMVNAFLGKAK